MGDENKPQGLTRNARGHFAAGNQSGVTGRPPGFRGLAKKIRERTQNGDALVEFAMQIFQGASYPVSERWKALEWLADRGYGKAAQIIEIAQTDPLLGRVDLTKLSDEKLEALEGILAEAAGVIDV